MKSIDGWAQRTLNIPTAVLMENAGRGCVEVLQKYFEPEGLKTLVCCGGGNNGGDGFVVARHLKNRGGDVKIILNSQAGELKGEALRNYKIAKSQGIEIIETTDGKKFAKILHRFSPTVIVDAIFGTGFKGQLPKKYSAIINFINDSGAFILAVDIPSGINGDTGQFDKNCIHADATATMCLPKRGNYLYPGRGYCGDLYRVDIGIPDSLIEKGYPQVIEFDDIYHYLPERPPDGHKGTFGQVLIVAGARGFSGAAAMAATSCLRTGAGLVRLAAPEGIMDVLAAKLLEVVKVPLPQTREETIAPGALDVLLPILKKTDIVVIGPGLTTNKETARFFFKFLSQINQPTIIDADGINIIAEDISFLKKIKAPIILTPHPGELSRMIKISPSEINRNRIALAEKYARDFNAVLVLKGAPTIIASPNEVYLNPTGNSGLATAGSGDVLVGMIGGFLAQNVAPIYAAVLGVFLHGLCAGLAVDNANEYSLIAGDLINYIPESINYIINKEYMKKI